MNPPVPTQESTTPPIQSVPTDEVHIVPNRTIPPETPPVPPKRPNMLIIVMAGVLFLGILGTGSYFAYQNYKLAKQPVTTTLASTPPTPTETPDPTASWVLYTNAKYKFSLKHPMEVSVLEEGLLGNFDLVFNKGAKNPFIIEVDAKGKVPAGSTGERKVGDVTWSEYVLPATKTTPSIYSLVTANGDTIFKVVGLYSKDLDPTILQILETFKFVPESSNPSSITGNVQIYSITDKTMTVNFTAKSMLGNVTEMKVWTDSTPSTQWEPFKIVKIIPVSTYVYVQYKDNNGNVSDVYNDTTNPPPGVK